MRPWPRPRPPPASRCVSSRQTFTFHTGDPVPKQTIRMALRDALASEMRRDPTVIVLGEDIVGGTGTEGELDCWGGPFGITKGLIGEFGPARVLDAPITETAIMGAAAGPALTGLRPVAELMFSDFFGVCFD